MTDFRFAHPYALILIPISLIFLYRWWQNRWRSRAGILQYSDIRLLTNSSKSLRLRFRQLPNIIRFIAWILLVIALARPQSGDTQNIIRGQGIDMVLAVDISFSMAIDDIRDEQASIQRTRLEAMKIVLKTFIEGRKDDGTAFDRIGMIVFANDTFQLAPPTLDYEVLAQRIDELKLAREVDLQDGSAIGQGIASAANLLVSSKARSKVVILLTDGENNVGDIDAISAARTASDLDISIYTIGIGQRGIFPVTLPDGTVENIQSNLDEETLLQIANIGDGQYYYALDLPDLEEIYDEIDQLERSIQRRSQYTRWQDTADLWIIGALILLILERILRHTLFQTIP